MRDARNDAPKTPGHSSGSSSAPFNGTNAGTTICISSSRSSRSSGRIDAGGARGAGVTGAGPLRAVSPGAAGGGRPFDLDHILGVARSVGLDAERLVRDMEDQAVDALIARNAILANALRVRGTPAFVIGDRMIRGALPLKQFRAAIADARVASEGGWNQRGAD